MFKYVPRAVSDSVLIPTYSTVPDILQHLPSSSSRPLPFAASRVPYTISRRPPFAVTDSMAPHSGNSAISSLAGVIGAPSSYAPQGYINLKTLSMQEIFHQNSSMMGSAPTTQVDVGYLTHLR
ncbi:hypothetical protein GYMLUDRAFT_1013410 [Collybiopsis luxurians FD-317 M1]|nr:hypothetical protein GYMLUDRAFT_1013410 [Collybiopsis luxurians FD-317 M1]